MKTQYTCKNKVQKEWCKKHFIGIILEKHHLPKQVGIPNKDSPRIPNVD